MQLAEMVQMNNSLQAIHMNNCELGAESLIAFATVLLTNKTLTQISLSNPRLTSLQGETVVHIASMLLVNRTLTYLDLSKNKIRDSHLEYLTDSLRRNDTLQILKLRGFVYALEAALHSLFILILATKSQRRVES